MSEDDSRNFITDFNSSTLLIDVPIDKLGTLVGLQSSITFVPDNLRKLWSRCMTKYLEAVRSDITNPMVWKKFFLVATVVCSNNSPLMRKQLIREKINLLLMDDWSKFTLGSLSPKSKLPFTSAKSITESTQQRAMKLAQVGEIGKALKALTTAAPPISPTHELFHALLEFFQEGKRGEAFKQMLQSRSEDQTCYYTTFQSMTSQ
jgi:hypothetical protein